MKVRKGTLTDLDCQVPLLGYFVVGSNLREINDLMI